MVQRDKNRDVPLPLILTAMLNGHECQCLIDSGSLVDVVSAKLADLLRLELDAFSQPVPVGMAVSGSRAVINFSAEVDFKCLGISEKRRFDVANIDQYDLILGTPFLYQHKITFGFNPFEISVGSVISLPLKGETIHTIHSHAVNMVDASIEPIRQALKEEARDLCKSDQTALSPLLAINDTIPLIDENKTIPLRPSKCPATLKTPFHEKAAAYLSSGRWEMENLS
ncbi:hypothetical protein SISNIDRAFT_476478 [Sistotremastrum niveocremeum HHB9708]|uniref:Aspartic peptidase DDI1-type domain-containing protein n=1 Tax=Sistotremastrum niveocremeum HHB9708 TaxID=1314777 RepID=A0A164M5R9_9AGAM|nr:hypothetical protein SISNIDRAFT_476478 [Sistotremastrum niveocremeum HHB9708]